MRSFVTVVTDERSASFSFGVVGQSSPVIGGWAATTRCSPAELALPTGGPRLAGFFFQANRRFRGEADVCRRRASSAPVADDPKRTSVALINGCRVVKSFRYLLTDPCELNILLRRPGWWDIGCSSIDNVVLDPG